MVLDILVAVLMACTIGYAFLLNRRLLDLKKDKKKLEGLAKSFNDATQRAEQSVAKLRVAAADVVDELRKGISDAEALHGDLELLLERGDAAADTLENAVRGATSKARSSSLPSARPASQPVKMGVEPGEGLPSRSRPADGQQFVDPSASHSEAARELMDALRAAR
ncbi:MAG: DUF6468 domain-containing protein [Proteobacteria bacterium]|nr:DUF6468 domain-containing protein [Pseudomonadota bacterium]